MSMNWRQYMEAAGIKSAGSGEASSKKKKPDAVQRRFQMKLKQDKVSFTVSYESVVERSVTRVVGLDCEMVGVQDGKESILARVSVVNSYGYCLYDTFVKPTEDVVDYRTSVSGVRPKDMERGVEFAAAQKAVAELLKGRILVGHAVRNDLRVLYLSHPKKRIRDTSK
ncbi:hypothetical protein J437_LFUL018443 [Ladona fulva]|uniref:Exonuclease domain-containing protein n=1 Tax=Ladona fulva TaxID=123851 RepID=A0A8K0PA90_LADFU|nr:hypothetical protein J437_LFUL018443 [Ladona fulva]